MPKNAQRKKPKVACKKQQTNNSPDMNALFQQIFANAQNGIIVYGPDMRYQMWNPFMERISGKSASEVIGGNPLELFPFLQKSGIVESHKKALAGGMPETKEFPFEIPGTGRKGWVSNTSGPLRNDEGEIIGVIAIVQDITVRKKAEDALKERERKITQLSWKAISSQEEERTRVARDLHDTLGQRLMAMSLEIKFLEKKIGPYGEHVHELKKMMSVIGEDVQRIYKGLRPVALEKLGLEAALESLVWEHKESGDYEIDLSISKLAVRIEPAKEIIIYRILQEALTNVARHSEATQVKVCVQREVGTLVMDVFDNGKGFSGAKESKSWGYGLTGMKERVSICGGTLEIASEPGSGTLVSVRIPILGAQEELKL